MGILEGALVTVLTEVLKRASKKLGYQMTTALVYIITAIAAIGYTVGSALASGDLQIASILVEAGTIWTASMGVYELIVKRVVSPTLEKISAK